MVRFASVEEAHAAISNPDTDPEVLTAIMAGEIEISSEEVEETVEQVVEQQEAPVVKEEAEAPKVQETVANPVRPVKQGPRAIPMNLLWTAVFSKTRY